MKTWSRSLENRAIISYIHPIGAYEGDEKENKGDTIFNKKMDKKGIAKMVGYKGPELTSSSSQNYNYLQSNYR